MGDGLERLIGKKNRWFSFSSNPAPNLQPGSEMQSPAACLPYDVLQEIFQYCMPPKPLMAAQPDNTVAPLVLCHICASWRIAAFGDHRLWQNLHVCLRPALRGIPYNDIRVPREQVEMIIWWTTRSANGDYTYSFKFTQHHVACTLEEGKKYVDYREVFRVPGVRSARSLTLVTNSEQWALVCRDKRPFARLRSLSLSMSLCYPKKTDLKTPHIPILSALEISDPRFASPWGQLTHLIVPDESTPFSWRDLLESCANLRSAMLYLGPVRCQGSKSIVHANLRQLVAQSHIVRPDLFQGILLPSLHSLRLSVIPYVTCYINGSMPISLGSIHTILRSTPSLRELHLHNCISFERRSLFLPLQTIDPLSMFTPHLEHLVISRMRGSTTNFSSDLAELVQSQWMCANWSPNSSSPSPSPSEHPRSGMMPHQLHVEVMLCKRNFLASTLEDMRSMVGDFDHPNVRLMIMELQEEYWEPLLTVGSKPGALDNWEELVKFRIPSG